MANKIDYSQESILIVDDEVQLLESLKRHFDLEGINADICSDPREVVQKLLNDHYNIIITDIKMPGMDGVELLRRIKDVNPMCVVIVMTAYSNMSYLLDCFSAGAADYFAKPFHDLDLLVDAVKCAIERVARWKKGMGFENFKGTP